MLKLKTLFAALLAFSLSYPADSMELPIGIAFDPPARLDLTYQVLPSYDEHEKVIAGWDDEELRYFIVVEKLPPNYTDAKKYFPELIGSMSVPPGTKIETGKIVSYRSQGGLQLSSMSYTIPEQGEDPKAHALVSLLTNNDESFVAIAIAIDPTSKDRLAEDTITLMQTARLSAVDATVQQRLNALHGTWVYKETMSDGVVLEAVVEVKPDKTFTSLLKATGAIDFKGYGTWGLTTNTIYWEYQRSMPPLPADKRKDADEIVSIESERLELKSETNGRTRVFKRGFTSSP